jgi:hypothetical protein
LVKQQRKEYQQLVKRKSFLAERAATRKASASCLEKEADVEKGFKPPSPSPSGVGSFKDSFNDASRSAFAVVSVAEVPEGSGDHSEAELKGDDEDTAWEPPSLPAAPPSGPKPAKGGLTLKGLVSTAVTLNRLNRDSMERLHAQRMRQLAEAKVTTRIFPH